MFQPPSFPSAIFDTSLQPLLRLVAFGLVPVSCALGFICPLSAEFDRVGRRVRRWGVVRNASAVTHRKSTTSAIGDCVLVP